VGLIAGALEEKGIRTVCLSTFEPIMKQVQPPRWLALPYPLGFPLGPPHRAELQTRILRRALMMFDESGPGPVSREYDPEKEA
jgi:hypothetical protein